MNFTTRVTMKISRLRFGSTMREMRLTVGPVTVTARLELELEGCFVDLADLV